MTALLLPTGEAVRRPPTTCHLGADMEFCCALCPEAFETEIDRAHHFAQAHPISDPDELHTLLEHAISDETSP